MVKVNKISADPTQTIECRDNSTTVITNSIEILMFLKTIMTSQSE